MNHLSENTETQAQRFLGAWQKYGGAIGILDNLQRIHGSLGQTNRTTLYNWKKAAEEGKILSYQANSVLRILEHSPVSRDTKVGFMPISAALPLLLAQEKSQETQDSSFGLTLCKVESIRDGISALETDDIHFLVGSLGSDVDLSENLKIVARIKDNRNTASVITNFDRFHWYLFRPAGMAIHFLGCLMNIVDCRKQLLDVLGNSPKINEHLKNCGINNHDSASLHEKIINEDPMPFRLVASENLIELWNLDVVNSKMADGL